MSEHSILKHSRKSVEIIKGQGNLFSKLKEVIFEVLIIVFAVRITLLMERWREASHDRHLEKEYLTELKRDFIIKMKELRNDSTGFRNIIYKLDYLVKAGRKEIPFIKDSVENYLKAAEAYYYFSPNDAIFESIKSSGKLNVIRNRHLRINIIKLFQQDLSVLQVVMQQFYYPAIEKYKQFSIAFKEKHSNGNNLSELVVNKPQLTNLLEELSNGYRKLSVTYNEVIKTNGEVLNEINLKLQK